MRQVIGFGGEKLTASQYFSKTYDRLFRFGEELKSYVCYPNIKEINNQQFIKYVMGFEKRKEYLIEFKLIYNNSEYLASKLEFSRCSCIRKVSYLEEEKRINLSIWREDEMFVPDSFQEIVNFVMKANFRCKILFSKDKGIF